MTYSPKSKFFLSATFSSKFSDIKNPTTPNTCLCTTSWKIGFQKLNWPTDRPMSESYGFVRPKCKTNLIYWGSVAGGISSIYTDKT